MGCGSSTASVQTSGTHVEGKENQKMVHQKLKSLNLRAKQVGMIKAQFELFDKENTGYIRQSDMKAVNDTLGLHLSDKALESLFAQSDIDHNGKISLDEYIVFVGPYFTADYDDEEKVMQLRRDFSKYDRNGDGQIDVNELRGFFGSQGDQVSEADLHKFIMAVDADKSNTISFQEYAAFIKKMLNG